MIGALPKILIAASLLFCSNAFAHSKVKIFNDANYRHVESNGLPNHDTGDFPNRRNPHSISAQDHSFKFSLNPKKASEITELGRYPFGVAINGIVFDPNTEEFWGDRGSNWNYDALSGKLDLGMDHNNAHVQPNGAYHYHGIPKDLLQKIKGNPKLVGWAADGFGIYVDNNIRKSSYILKKGERASGPKGKYDGSFNSDYEYSESMGELDECNGMTPKITKDGQEVYYYVLTENFPNIPRCFQGNPDPSFFRNTKDNMNNMRGAKRGRRLSPDQHHNLTKSAQELGIDIEDLKRALGIPPPNLYEAARTLGIKEEELRKALRH